mmetsp:Transcript_71104/g.140955  ORF Transcript_71104/g.140955 Transcript_71104/m.140955 type:complete len:159 (+) Transcript_71104:726-1202(+)
MALLQCTFCIGALVHSALDRATRATTIGCCTNTASKRCTLRIIVHLAWHLLFVAHSARPTSRFHAECAPPPSGFLFIGRRLLAGALAFVAAGDVLDGETAGRHARRCVLCVCASVAQHDGSLCDRAPRAAALHCAHARWMRPVPELLWGASHTTGGAI